MALNRGTVAALLAALLVISCSSGALAAAGAKKAAIKADTDADHGSDDTYNLKPALTCEELRDALLGLWDSRGQLLLQRVDSRDEEAEVDRLLDVDEGILRKIQAMKKSFITICSKKVVHETMEEALDMWRAAKEASRDILKSVKGPEKHSHRRLLETVQS